jgi:hypothetical protein
LLTNFYSLSETERTDFCGRCFDASSNKDNVTKDAFKNGFYGTPRNSKRCWCHHFTSEGAHIVLNSLDTDSSEPCKGVFFGNKDCFC